MAVKQRLFCRILDGKKKLLGLALFFVHVMFMCFFLAAIVVVVMVVVVVVGWDRISTEKEHMFGSKHP